MVDGVAVSELGVDAVRRYLLGLSNPDALIDHAEVDRLQGLFAGEPDPVERLRLFSRWERASRVDLGSLEVGFVGHARAFASANDIPTSAFVSMGVPRRVLVAAGMLPSVSKKRNVRRPGPQQRRVSASAVASATPDAVFTAAELANRSGGSVELARKVLADLVGSKMVEVVDPPSDWVGVGRAPVFYRRLKTS